ncbi:hypothetical protein Lesp02_18960 [Lentzea sp. NBRC 105346]|nr:hypothetical protein Lesp02_18960 [Lentzea sp. NBRC 105346]
MVPGGASAVTLCVYKPDLQVQGGWRIDAPATVRRGAGAIVESLNSMGPAKPNEAGCFLALRTQYRLLIDYPDRPTAVVDVDMNCALVSSGDAVREGDVSDTLDVFAEAFRDEGGQIEAPPWKW